MTWNWLLANQCHQSCVAGGFPIFICLSTPTFLSVAFVVAFCSFICCFSLRFFLLFVSSFFQDSRRAKDSPIIALVSQCRQLILRSGTGASFSSLFLLRLLVVLCRCEMLNAPMHILLTATASSSSTSTSSADADVDADVDAACCPQGPLLSCAALASRGPLLPSVSVFL